MSAEEEDYDFDDEELEGLELDESELAELEAFEQQLEDVDEETLGALDLEKGNVFIGAMKPRSSEEVLAELEREMEREAEEAKSRSMLNTCRPGVVPKYLVNPFALEDPMDYEEVFGDIDKEEPQLRVWRIDRFAPVEASDENWGKFHTGDCYIVLFITDDDEQLVIHIHHWIGLQATPDKYGAAAFRAVELNTYLGGGCRIYREVEATESKMFVDYFGDRIEYLFGGTPCAFRHVDLDKPREYPTRMYVLAKNPASTTPCMELVDLGKKHFFQDRIIILDCGTRIFIWNGRLSSFKDRHTALQYAVTIRNDERDGTARIVIVTDGNEDFDSQYDIEFFWKTLGGRVAEPPLPEPEVKTVAKISKRFMYIGTADNVVVFGSWDNFTDPCPMEKVEEDEWDLEVPLLPGEYLYNYKKTEGGVEETLCDEVRPQQEVNGKVYNVVKAEGVVDDGKFLLYTTCEREDGRLNLEGVDYGDDLRTSVLDTCHAYILDCKSELFVWFGLRCNPLEKDVAIALANKFLEFERPLWASIILTQETAEPSSFRSKFTNWRPRQRPRPPMRAKSLLSVKFDLPAVVNVESQLRRAVMEPPHSIVATSAGTLDVYVTGDGASFESVPAHHRGIFFNGSSYVVVYKYSAPRARHLSYLVYFWSGIASNSNSEFSRFVLDFLSVLTKRVGADRVIAERVRQGKEPMDFMRLFGQRMVVQNGSFATHSRHNTPSARLFDVANREVFDTLETRAVEVPADCSSLSTERCFILMESKQVRVWLGRGTNDTVRGRALDIAAHLRKSDKQHRPEVNYFEEDAKDSSSRAEFLAFLSGSEEAISSRPVVAARAYCCSFSGGLLEINELLDFCQYDLSLREQDTILVHTEKVLYVWVGPRATPSVFKAAMDSSELWMAYTAEHLTKQELRVVHGGEEGEDFRELFHAWTGKVYAFEDKIGEQREEQLRSNAFLDGLTQRNDKVYARLQERMELLEQVASSTRYSEEEEKQVLKAKHMLRVDWEKVWMREGLLPAKVAPEPSALEKYRAAVGEEETLFIWEEGNPLAVSLAGSWNDWKPQPMLQMGTEGFALTVQLPVGRYYYHYCVATDEGVRKEMDGQTVAVDVKARDGERNNVLRVYACVMEPEQEEEEEEEEEDLSKLTAEEIVLREKEWRDQQRAQREQRLQRKLTQQRELYASKAAKRAAKEAASPRSGSPRAARRSRASLGTSSSPSSSGAFMEGLLGTLGASGRVSGLGRPARKTSASRSSGSVRSRPSAAAAKPRARKSLGDERQTPATRVPSSGSLPSVSSLSRTLSSKSAAINTSLEAIAIVDAASATAKEKAGSRSAASSLARRPSSEAVTSSAARITAQLDGEEPPASLSVSSARGRHRRRRSSEAAEESAARLEKKLSGGEVRPAPAARSSSRVTAAPAREAAKSSAMAGMTREERRAARLAAREAEGRASASANTSSASTTTTTTTTTTTNSAAGRRRGSAERTTESTAAAASSASKDEERERRRAERRRQLGLA